MKLKTKSPPLVKAYNKGLKATPKTYAITAITMPTAPLPKLQTLKSITDVSNADFVKVWMTSKTNLEVAKKLHLTPGQTTSRASFLRNKGVNLPRKINAHDPNSVEALNKIVRKYTGK